MRYFYISLGFLCLILGILGTFLPVLPTTPFLLCTLFFFGKSSPRLEAWFKQSRIYHKYLKTFNEQRALTKKAKIYILCISTLMMALSAYAVPHILGKISIVILLLIEYWFFFFWIKTLPNTQIDENAS
ncbi:membrane protein [Gallibacterium salpingitidis]|uniref:Inner membrane protein n=1 Tax=Gallibacterium salpingitidis TaxID=505341 RepID=A0A1A7Q1G1_9PAST|nr:YbaN family protein [Gallibacterium salpingitidis]OBW95067.1 membrane protein [Gallibacterium salpingitidis]OBX08094.1 membrane protein [Gallibacterium salpingitidis]OBX11737.1 membrane protein [Gallibacterium salpingitidis]WKT00038.1 YbaN family protein [Gallibacterium salpingitidis]